MNVGELKMYKYKYEIIFQLMKFDASATISVSSIITTLLLNNRIILRKKIELFKILKMDWSNR